MSAFVCTLMEYMTSLILEKLNYKVSPSTNGIRADIVQTITFNDPNKLILFCQGIMFV